MAKRTSHHHPYRHGPTEASRDIPDAVSYQHSDDLAGNCPLPEHGSHSQGQAHSAHRAPHDPRSPMQPRDRQFPGKRSGGY